MEKTRDLFQKTGDTKGVFHAKMGSIKDRNGKDLTEEEKLRCSDKNTENCTKKVSMTQITMMMWSLTQDQTSWNAKSSGHQEALLQSQWR